MINEYTDTKWELMKTERLLMGGPLNGQRLEVLDGAREFFAHAECYRPLDFELSSGVHRKMETVYLHPSKNSEEALKEWCARQ